MKPTSLKLAATLIATVAVATCLAGCIGGASSRSRGITVAYQAADGTVKFRRLDTGQPATEFLSTGIMQEGHMPAPAPASK